MTNTTELSWSLASITATVEDNARERREAEERLHTLVDQARGDGATWQQIADQLGTTRQAAHERFHI